MPNSFSINDSPLLSYKYLKAKNNSNKNLLVLHGLLGCADNWLPQGQIFSECYNVIIPDLRNHGNSFHNDSMTYEDMANDILRLLDYLHLEQISLIGHSMGGKLAMLIALNHLDIVDKLIVIDIAPDRYITDANYKLLNILASIPMNEFKSRKEIKNSIKDKVPNFREVDLILKNIKLNSQRKYEWKINLAALINNINILADFPTLDKKFAKPVLFLSGEKSNHILPQHYDKIYYHFPNAYIKTVSNAGHWVQVDNTDEFIKYSLEYLNNDVII